jgi:hypothetical protein
MVDDPVLDRRLEKVGLPPAAESKPELFTVGAGFKFGFGFAAGVFVFGMIFSWIGFIFFATFIASMVHAFIH